jgi:membrane protein YqaA with SNARE-associated domain
MMYFASFAAALLVDTIPVFAPPAWIILTFLIVKFDLNPWGVVVLGTTGSTIGRYILSRYIPKVSNKILSENEEANVSYVGKKIGKHFWSSFVFVLIYSITPMSTTALFTAAGMARVNPFYILPAFFMGKFTSDAVMVFTGKYEAHTFQELMHGKVSGELVIVALLGTFLIFGMLFIDWPMLLTHKKVRLHFKIWRH